MWEKEGVFSRGDREDCSCGAGQVSWRRARTVPQTLFFRCLWDLQLEMSGGDRTEVLTGIDSGKFPANRCCSVRSIGFVHHKQTSYTVVGCIAADGLVNSRLGADHGVMTVIFNQKGCLVPYARLLLEFLRSRFELKPGVF